MLRIVFQGLARGVAILGGIVLTLLIVLITISVIGRAGNTIAHTDFLKENLAGLSQLLIASGVGPVDGDFELVEAGIAFSIFAFLPWCQLRRGHANVDLFAFLFPTAMNRAVDLISEVLLSSVTCLLTWRLYVGMGDKLRYGETTFLLQFPVWWAYAASFAAALIASIVSIYAIVVRVQELRTMRLYETGSGGSH